MRILNQITTCLALAGSLAYATTIRVDEANFTANLGGIPNMNNVSSGVRVSSINTLASGTTWTTNGTTVGGSFDASYTMTFNAYRNIDSLSYFTANDGARGLLPVANARFSALSHSYTTVGDTRFGLGVEPNLSNNTTPTTSLAGQIDSGTGGGEAIVIDFSRPSTIRQMTFSFAMGANPANSSTGERDPRINTASADITSGNTVGEIIFIRARRASGEYRDYYMRVLSGFDSLPNGSVTPTSASAVWFRLGSNSSNGSTGDIAAASVVTNNLSVAPAPTIISNGTVSSFLGGWTLGNPGGGSQTDVFSLGDITRLELLPYRANGTGFTASDFALHSITATPEPWSFLLGGTAIAALALRRRYMKRA